MANTPQTLNQYVGTDELGNGTTIVAENMTTACSVYAAQKDGDPVIMQRTKSNILCVLPEQFTTFVTEVWDTAGAASSTCQATPERYTLLAGTKQIFTARAGEGWKFSKWLIDGEEVGTEEGTKEVALLTIPAASTIVTIRAVFVAQG